MKRVAIYARKSTEHQKEATLEYQVEQGELWCAEHGYNVIAILEDTYTGTELERPEMDKLRQMVKDGLVDVIVIWKYDRLARKMMDQGFLLYEWERAGVIVESVKENFDDTPEGQLLRQVIAWMAEREHKTIMERTAIGRRKRVEGGKPLFSDKPLYGYLVRDDRAGYVRDPLTAPVVERIFQMAADGVSLREICRTLVAEGVPAPRGGKLWPETTVQRILENPAYWGKYTALRLTADKTPNRKIGKDGRRLKNPRTIMQAGIILPEGTAPALVSEELAMRAQGKRRGRGGQSRRIHPLRLLEGFVFCGDDGYKCRCSYIGGYPRYTCPYGNIIPSMRCSNTKTATQLDEQVWEDVVKQLGHPEDILAHKRQAYEALRDEALKWYEYAAKLQEEQNRMYKAWSEEEDETMKAMARNRLKQIEAELKGTKDEKGVEAKRDELAEMANQAAEDMSLAGYALTQAKWSAEGDLTMEQKRIILKLVGCRVEMKRREERGVSVTVSLNPGFGSEPTLRSGGFYHTEADEAEEKVTPVLPASKSTRGHNLL